MKFLEHRIADRRIVRLIQKWLKARVSEEGEWSETAVGTPQGAVVSPLLANIYLHYVFDLWASQWRRTTAKGDMIVVRYADDAVLGFEDRAEAEAFLEQLRERMRKFGLELHPEKTRLIEFGRYAEEHRARRGEGINTSYSLPLGIYVRTHDRDARLIEFCPVEPFASESSKRGYRTHGTACADGAVPLLKPIVAVAGDRVVLSAEGMCVNGRLLPKTAPLFRDAAGRSLHPWPFGTYVVEHGVVWVASTYNRGSYDSRYMGPISISQIRARLRPLWLL